MLKMSKEASEMFPGSPFVFELSIISNIFSVLAILSTLPSVRDVKTVLIYLENFSVPVLEPILNNLIGAKRMALNHWEKENLLKKDGNATMRLEGKSNNFVIVDEYINHPKAQEQITQSFFC